VKRKKYTLEQVTVTNYAAEGKAFAKVDGKALFIEGAVPGDVVDVFVSTNKKDWAQGKVTKFHSYAPDRITPFCAHFGTCGGCKWQMLPYEKQLQFKQEEVAQNIRRIGHVTLGEMLPIAGAQSTQYYRNKLEFTFSNKRYLTDHEVKSLPREEGAHAGGPALGFHVPRIFDKVIDIQHCYLMDPVNDRIRNSIRIYALEQNLPFYDIKQHTGWLRNIIIRNCSTGELMVNICLGYEDEAATKLLLDHLLAQVPEITTLLYTINTKWNDSIYDLQPITYFGKGYAIEKLGKYSFKVGPKSFFQTNTQQATLLYEITRDFAGLTGQEVVYDLYCGTGSIGIFVSDRAKKIIGVEVIAEAIEDAKENAALNNIAHAEFFAGDVIQICDDAFFAKHGRPDVVITDPPRVGMHEKLVNKLLEIAAPRIVYVSCNTATQARDLALLQEKYEVVKIQPVDMFPHTHHIESVALLELKKP
jgi:23S rRNA (uracil1939-C5)-methyltransferase